MNRRWVVVLGRRIRKGVESRERRIESGGPEAHRGRCGRKAWGMIWLRGVWEWRSERVGMEEVWNMDRGV